MNPSERDPLTNQIIGRAMKVHSKLGFGFVESVYQKALEVELKKAALSFHSNKPMQVPYEGVIVGEFISDLIINDEFLLELKAVYTLALDHEIQTVNYLNATGIETGLLLNFGGARLEVKRKFRAHRSSRRKIDLRGGAIE